MNNRFQTGQKLFAARDGGFTLVELLVAATIIGILAVFATVSYRNGVAETRFAQAKTMTDQLAAAVQRAKAEHHMLRFYADPMTNPMAMNCTLTPYSSEVFPYELISCGYLERSGWQNEYFQFYICDQKTPPPCNSTDADGNSPVACARVAPNAKLPSQYAGHGYCYFGRSGGVEYTGL